MIFFMSLDGDRGMGIGGRVTHYYIETGFVTSCVLSLLSGGVIIERAMAWILSFTVSGDITFGGSGKGEDRSQREGRRVA